jgi:hypothetical protein
MASPDSRAASLPATPGLPGSVRDRDRAVSASISSPVIANATACRHPAMMPLLVRSTTNEESANKLPVP